jgi:hypothetical protein
MTVDQYENSRSRGEPINLYLFTYGQLPNAYYGYTDCEHQISYLGKTYNPIPIDRDKLTSSGTLDKTAFRMRLPRGLPISDLFRVYPPNQVVTLVLMQGHANDAVPQYLVCWTGRVVSSDIKGDQIEFTCEPVATSMRRSGLRRNYQYGCSHALYGPRCNANKAAAQVIQAVVSATAYSVTLPNNWFSPFQESHFLGGLAEWVNTDTGEREIRTILKITGTVIDLSGIVRGLGSGGSIELFKGCDRTMAGCNTHNNIHNFGGQPWIPTKNPIVGPSPFS